jgi:hypothetical protein
VVTQNEWIAPVWQEINDGVVKEVSKIRIAQKVFPTRVFDTSPPKYSMMSWISPNLSIREGRTKPFDDIHHEFPLTNTQVAQDLPDIEGV